MRRLALLFSTNPDCDHSYALCHVTLRFVYGPNTFTSLRQEGEVNEKSEFLLITCRILMYCSSPNPYVHVCISKYPGYFDQNEEWINLTDGFNPLTVQRFTVALLPKLSRCAVRCHMGSLARPHTLVEASAWHKKIYLRSIQAARVLPWHVLGYGLDRLYTYGLFKKRKTQKFLLTIYDKACNTYTHTRAHTHQDVRRATKTHKLSR